MGAQSTYMAGHLHDQIFYKWLGTEAPKLLGNRTKKWTDTDVVETLQLVKDLIDAGAFDPSAAGITDDVAATQFQQGEAAMIITGPWNISNFSDTETTAVAEHVRLAKFPYFSEKPENKDEDMQVLSPYMISGKLEGRELELTIELVKTLTNKDAAKRFAEEAAFLIPRNDIELDESKTSDLFRKSVELGGTSTGICVSFSPSSATAAILSSVLYRKCGLICCCISSREILFFCFSESTSSFLSLSWATIMSLNSVNKVSISL